MANLKRILITPFFGELPEWMNKFQPPEDYAWLLDTDINSFRQRVKRVLGIEYPGLPGSGKVWDYRCALGLLYAEEIKGFDYWGHCDFDMVFGRVNEWFPDEVLNTLEIWSNHDTYVCGCWTLYRNTPIVNGLFMWDSTWKQYMIEPEPNGWVERQYSRIVENSGLSYKYSFHQGNPYTTAPNLKKIGSKLYQDGIEIPMFHFRRSKRWPL